MTWKTGTRKVSHLELAMRESVEHGNTWLDDVILVHESIPEMDMHKIDTSVKFLGKELKAPLMIVGMTGGVEEAKRINKDLASVAENLGVAFGVGSQRAMLEKPEMWETYYVRDSAPNALVFGNIGLPQLAEYGVDAVVKAVRKIKADGIAVHLNPAQEAVQPEGDWDFSFGLENIDRLAKKVPVMVKETGNGICREVAIRLKKAGVRALDVGGFGGTNWVKIEAMRAGENTPFVNWGIPTAASILEASPVLPVVATGGIRTGLDVAKALALGATIGGMALPVLRWYLAGGKVRVESELLRVIKELKTAMFLTGSRNVHEIRETNLVVTGRLKDWCLARGIDIKHYANREIGKEIF